MSRLVGSTLLAAGMAALFVLAGCSTNKRLLAPDHAVVHHDISPEKPGR